MRISTQWTILCLESMLKRNNEIWIERHVELQKYCPNIVLRQFILGETYLK